MNKRIIGGVVILAILGLLYYGSLPKNDQLHNVIPKNEVSTGTQKTADKVDTNNEPSYPIDSDAVTTLEKTVMPIAVPASGNKLLPYEIAKYKENGYGFWQFSGGLNSQRRLDLMDPKYAYTGVSNTAKLLKFFTMTDIHLFDEETPSQGIYWGYKGGNSSAYSPVMLLTTQVLDAAIQTINAINKKSPVDFVISLGDTINNNQHNELRWYIDIFDGKTINPDSGVKDDPIPGAHNDYQDEFKAAGLDKTIPWYQVLGNHDHFGMGSYPINDYLRKSYTGEEILNIGAVFDDPLGVDSRGFYAGSIDGRTQYGDVIGAGPVEDFKTPPKVVADADRYPVTRKQWISEFLNTSSIPAGHGFSQTNVDNDFASYTFEPKSDIPVKIIVLDDTQKDEDFDIKGHGYLDEARYNWLISELDKGQSEGKLMIIAAHIPLALVGLTPNSFVSAKGLVAKLQKYPNLLLWVSGHRHRNVVTPRKSSDITHPELGFWEVETSSLRDYPQQLRNFEITRNSDNNISIFTTNVDPAVKKDSLAELSRSYSIAAWQIFGYKAEPQPTGSYNAELLKQLTPEMQTKIKDYGNIINK